MTPVSDAAIVLATRALVSGYEPDLPIVRGVDLQVTKGEFLLLLGPNGAGKSTLVKTIAGLVPVHSGAILHDGADLTAMPPHLRVRHGLAFVPQTENVFTTMTIHENLLVAAQVLPRERRAGRIADLYAMFPDLARLKALRAGQLSGGQRQMLAVARALIVEPSVLILDEPSAGLAPKVVQDVFANLKAINAAGVTTVLVEQNVKAALAIADRAIVLVEGEVRLEGDARTLGDDAVVAELYLGSRHRPAEARR
ncbi:ABC transporter ATP-binding protein [Aquibium sp. ELW1220]|uniref:ABC transporter ATP-binding protein n=1 Tax=Aquibium sp. ELW1220 TaxID=2976766 RepID=UPI0025B0BCD1|nr:ABC transporter ATP-binding protein [Aquibium sp. ELW1220]MDN2581222.1 ABC transporter ATP-binding protein [Aquibium sp. ELW1220]